MKTYLLDIIPSIQRYSQKLDNIATLTNKHWVLIDEEQDKKVVFIFREKGNQLLISSSGKVEKCSWEYIGSNSLLIDKEDGSYLFKHGFVDEDVLALKVDGKEEFALFVNEEKFKDKLYSIPLVVSVLTKNYIDKIEQKPLDLAHLEAEKDLDSIYNLLEEEKIPLTSLELRDYYVLENGMKENELIVIGKFERSVRKFSISGLSKIGSNWKARLLANYHILKLGPNKPKAD